MKRMMMFAIACVLLAIPAYSVGVPSPMWYDTLGIVGTVEGQAGSANETIVTGYANTLIDMLANKTDGIYRTGFTEYTLGSPLLAIDAVRINDGVGIDAANSAAGFLWVMAKYDGPSAGYVLFNMKDYYAAHGTFEIPRTPEDFWATGTEELAISNITGWGSYSVPDGGMTLMLLGGALIGLEGLRRKFRV